jgi:hypothetical protein
MKVYNKEHLLNDPEIQKKMLTNRKISGIYRFKDGTDFTYTGSYEKDFLEVMNHVLSWNSADLLLPAPEVIQYKDPDSGVSRFFIPDVYIISLNLVIEIKASDNNHYRKRDINIELAKDAAIIETKKFRYIKVFDKDYNELIHLIKQLRIESLES